eukprot:6174141-Pleurochrysis_carterae.AAC.1
MFLQVARLSFWTLHDGHGTLAWRSSSPVLSSIGHEGRARGQGEREVVRADGQLFRSGIIEWLLAAKKCGGGEG